MADNDFVGLYNALCSVNGLLKTGLDSGREQGRELVDDLLLFVKFFEGFSVVFPSEYSHIRCGESGVAGLIGGFGFYIKPVANDLAAKATIAWKW